MVASKFCSRSHTPDGAKKRGKPGIFDHVRYVIGGEEIRVNKQINPHFADSLSGLLLLVDELS